MGGTAGNAITLVENATNLVASGAALSGGTGVSFQEGVDYTVDYDNGVLHITDNSAIVDGTDIDVYFGTRSSTRERVISGSTPVEGALMYIAANPKGTDFNYMLPWIKVTPNGDYALKGDEWQQIPLNIEILKPTNKEAIYMNGRPLSV